MSSNNTSFPSSTLIDYEKLCHTYMAVIDGKADALKEDAVNNLMVDLEQILVDATKVKKSFDDLHQSKAVNDRKREHEMKTKKKIEEPSETVSKKPKLVDPSLRCMFTPLSLSKPKTKPVDIFDDDIKQQPGATPYDTPKEFWKSVDPYCPSITPDFLQYLEQMTKPMDKNDEIFKIPELGQNYLEKWRNEDNKSDSMRTNRPEDSNQDDIFLSNLFSSNLTQRLYGAFLEDPTHKTPAALSQIASNNGKQEKSTEGGGGVVRLNKASVEAFEQVLKNELAHQGILDVKRNKQEDEIEAELRRCQAELQVLNESSCNIFQQLHLAATERLKKEEKRNEAAQLATQLQKYYQRLATNRQKKKLATKKEKADLRNLLDQFEKISEEI